MLLLLEKDQLVEVLGGATLTVSGVILSAGVVAVVSEVMAGGPVVFALFFGIPFGGLAILTTAVGVILNTTGRKIRSDKWVFKIVME